MSALPILILLFLATVLLVTERLRADIVAMLVLAALVTIGVLDTDRALSGFSNPATITVAAMFILSAGLQSTGVVQLIGDRLLQHGPRGPRGIMLLTAIVVGAISAFINNTAAVAVFLPVVLRACQGRGISPSKLMMPLSFMAMLGGTCTLIGTSTNIVVSSIAEDHRLQPFGMFEFTPLGLLLLGGGAVYLIVVAPRLLPDRVQAENLTEGFHLNLYLSEVVVLEGSPLIGQTVREAQLGERYDLEVLGHVRQKVLRPAVDGFALAAGDILLVKAPAAALVQLRDTAGIAVRSGRRPDEALLRSAESVLVEAVIVPNSDLEGRTLKRIDFRNRFGATALAVRRHGEDIREKIGHVPLRVGDELLILATRERLPRLRQGRSFVILQELDVPIVNPLRALLATAIVGGVVALAALGLYRIAEAAILGAVLMVLTGCLPARKAYDSIDWQVVFLLAGLLPLGLALEATGAAEEAARWVLHLTGGLGPQVVMSTFFFFAAACTGVMSNNATAALLAPLAISAATTIDVDPRPFLIALSFASSAAFYTPIGYQTNLLVYGPGGYRFFDFVRLGLPLTLLSWVLVTFLVPLLFPF